MFKNVIVPVDRSADAERALEPAAALASQFGGAVVAVHSTSPVGAAEAEAYLRELITARQELGELGGSPATWEYKVRWDDAPLPAILSEVAAREPALLCVASHAHGRVSTTMFGSMSAALVREAGAPVVMVGPACTAAPLAYDELIVPVDGSSLSEGALDAATEWARGLGLKVQVVNVVDPEDAAVLEGGDIQEDGYVRRMALRLRDAGVDADWDTLHDADPADAIVRHVANRPGALLVMTTHGRSGFQLLSFGSVASRVVHNAGCPVLLLCPGA